MWVGRSQFQLRGQFHQVVRFPKGKFARQIAGQHSVGYVGQAFQEAPAHFALPNLVGVGVEAKAVVAVQTHAQGQSLWQRPKLLAEALKIRALAVPDVAVKTHAADKIRQNRAHVNKLLLQNGARLGKRANLSCQHSLRHIIVRKWEHKSSLKQANNELKKC